MNVKKIAILIIPIFLLSAIPVLASSNNKVVNMNGAMVHNEVMVGANTGRNLADGSYGGSGGSGGNISNIDGSEENGDVRDSVTGRGGDGGAAAIGGTVVTGDATVTALVSNDVNNNLTTVDYCACEKLDEDCCENSEEDCCENSEEDCCDENIRVKNMNFAMLDNRLIVGANTGRNDALGSYGGEGGGGGSIKNSGDGDVDGSTTSLGGNGGAGGEGGVVQTGASVAISELMNMVNTNITRIRR